jgi:hypothetical protein
MGEDNYYEGASHECLNFRGLYENHPNLDTIVVLDVMGDEALIRQPRDLYDSWVQSIIVPLVQVAKNNLELFALKDNRGWHRTKGARADLMVMPFDLTEDDQQTALDWSYSNGSKLFDIGYRSAQEFLKGQGAKLKANSEIESLALSA